VKRARGSAPRGIARGATVGVVAPGFAVRPGSLDAGVRRLRRMGYEVRLGQHVYAREGYFAGADELRAADLAAMLADPKIAAVWFARGGYGTARILDRVPWRALQKTPKPLVGYSDLTALFCAAVQRTSAPCLHGPTVNELGRPATFHAPSLRRLLRGEGIELRLTQRQVLAPGQAAGRLLGGNLTVLAHLLGTPYSPDFRNAVLFLEEVGEEAYRVDRALTHLAMAGAFRSLAAVLIGRSSVPPRRKFPPDRTLGELLAEFFLPLGVPVVRDVPAGHVDRKWTLPIGGQAALDTVAGRLRLAL